MYQTEYQLSVSVFVNCGGFVVVLVSNDISISNHIFTFRIDRY